jgi:hypothetical protein
MSDTVAISRNRYIFPVALDDIHLASRTVAAPPKDDGLRRRLVVVADLKAEHPQGPIFALGQALSGLAAAVAGLWKRPPG